jgi:hypothetical protein
MKEYFVEQLENPKYLTEEMIQKLRGKTFFYEDFQVGDNLLYLMIFEMIEDEQNLFIKVIIETELERFGKLYKFVELRNEYPVFIREENVC